MTRSADSSYSICSESENHVRRQTKPNGQINDDELRFSTERTSEITDLLHGSLEQLLLFVSKADQEQLAHQMGSFHGTSKTSLVSQVSLDPDLLQERLTGSLTITDEGTGSLGFQNLLKDILEYSVNTLAPGFMDKLYSAPLAPGLAAEVVLAFLNTNVHVYQVSPVLTLIEKVVTKQFASLFGLSAPRAGGITVAGGSASNLTSIVVARNILFPETKIHGNFVQGRQLVMFTSADGHYSIEKAAQGLGLGSSAVVSVPTDGSGAMRVDELERLIVQAKAEGKTPFYVNATAGTTVLGSFDPFEAISRVTRKHRCWLHVDGAWGGSFIFSQKEAFRAKLRGIQLADSISVNPHKMLGVPITCSFLLTRDLRLFQSAMTLKAGYLFHDPEDSHGDENATITNDETKETTCPPRSQPDGTTPSLYDLGDVYDPEWTEPNDLADMTLQCGRRGDSLKFFMAWQYYGTAGYAKMVENAYDTALYLNELIDDKEDLTLVLGPGTKPSCLQVSFYYTPAGKFVFGLKDNPGFVQYSGARSVQEIGKRNTRVTARISKALIARGFMIDYAPPLEGQKDRGSFLRVVVNISTIKETVERLVDDILVVGDEIVTRLCSEMAQTTSA